MSALTKEQVEQVIAGWREGLDDEQRSNPAGPVFSSGDYSEYEITMTGQGGPATCSEMSMSYDPVTGQTYYCC